MADIAQEWRDLALDQKQDVYEFTRAGYHLSMDAAGEYGEELSFILWRVEADGLQPMLTGQTRRSRLLISEPEYANEQVKVEAIIRSMISGERPVPRYDEHDDYDDTEPMVPPQREQRRARR